MVAPKKIKHKAVLNFIEGSSETTLVKDSNWNIHPNMAKNDSRNDKYVSFEHFFGETV